MLLESDGCTPCTSKKESSRQDSSRRKVTWDTSGARESFLEAERVLEVRAGGGRGRQQRGETERGKGGRMEADREVGSRTVHERERVGKEMLGKENDPEMGVRRTTRWRKEAAGSDRLIKKARVGKRPGGQKEPGRKEGKGNERERARGSLLAPTLSCSPAFHLQHKRGACTPREARREGWGNA